jgi:hypothetical protein
MMRYLLTRQSSPKWPALFVRISKEKERCLISKDVRDSSARAGCPYCLLIKQTLFGMFYPEDIETFSITAHPGAAAIRELLVVILRPSFRPKKDPRLGFGHSFSTQYILFSNPQAHRSM